MKEIKKEDWLNKIPDLIYLLKVKYNFYFSGYYVNINKDILEVTLSAKHKHKIIIYNRDNRFFLVIYKKSGPDIYYINEYRNDTKPNRISYFMNKFRRAYKKAEVEYEQKESEQIKADFNRYLESNDGRL